MAYGFRSVGTVVTGFNSTITPVAPAGFQAGDLLIYAAWEFVGSNSPPDLSASGFTILSDAATVVVKGCAIYGKIAVGGDTIPGINYGNQRTGAVCAAYTGAPTTISSISNISPVTRSSTATTSVFWNTATPTIGGCLLIALLCRNQSGSSSVSFGTTTPWTQRAISTPAASSAPVAFFGDWIQSNAATTNTGAITTSPADATNQSVFSQIVTLNPPPPPAGGGGTGTAFPPAQRKKYIYYNNYYPR